MNTLTWHVRNQFLKIRLKRLQRQFDLLDRGRHSSRRRHSVAGTRLVFRG
ncbi:MAG: hypothetical protein P8M65_09520 [Roseibacillus sp.]|nr:hypothetical protein [Roseibacillus sp.]